MSEDVQALETLRALVREDGNDPNTVAALDTLIAQLERAEQMAVDLNEGYKEQEDLRAAAEARAQKAEAVVEELRGVAGGVIWLDNNLDKYGTEIWREFFKATLRDARRAYAPTGEPPTRLGGIEGKHYSVGQVDEPPTEQG